LLLQIAMRLTHPAQTKWRKTNCDELIKGEGGRDARRALVSHQLELVLREKIARRDKDVIAKFV
jgi:hypothetical protein